jgi:hypothetical protein
MICVRGKVQKCIVVPVLNWISTMLWRCMEKDIFLTLALVRGEWSASHPSHFTPRERAPGTHWIGGWVGPRTNLDCVERRKVLPILGLELRPIGCPACRQSSYRLHYPSVHDRINWNILQCLYGILIGFYLCQYSSETVPCVSHSFSSICSEFIRIQIYLKRRTFSFV